MDESRAVERRMHRMNLLFPLILIAAVTVFTLFGGSSSSVVTQINGNTLGIANAEETTFIDLSDIRSVDLVDRLDIGTAETDDVLCIRYHNDEFGNYLLYAWEDTTTYVVIHTSDQVVVVNAKNEKKTEAFYNELTAAIAAL